MSHYKIGNNVVFPVAAGFRMHAIAEVVSGQYPPVSTGRLWLNTDYSAYDWGRDSLFLDVMRTARAWRATVSSPAFIYDDPTARSQMMATADADGYPTVLPANTSAGTSVLREQGAASAPALGGRYRLVYLGAGTIVLEGVTNRTDHTGYIEFDFVPTDSNALDIRITATTQGNHIRGLKCYMVQHAALVAAGQVVHPAFKAAYGGIGMLRFMMCQDTNANLQTTWATVPQPTSIGRGVSWLEMAKVCNELGCGGWFNFPAAADANHVTQAMTVLRDNMNPLLRICIEYGNEPWNSSSDFRTYHYLNELTAVNGLTVYENWGGRSTECMIAASAVFAGQMHRITRVMGVQTGYTGLTEQFWNATGWVAAVPGRVAPSTVHDALAVTGYFNVEYSRWPSVIAAATANYQDGINLALAEMRVEIANHLNTFWPYFKAFADARGKQVLMYEGNTHMYNPGGHGNDALANQIVTDINRSELVVPLMGEMMTNWALFSSVPGGAGYNVFDASRKPTATGEFGLRQTINVATPRSTAAMSYNAGTFPVAPVATARPLNMKLVVSGHSIPDATSRTPLAEAITAMGGTVQKWTATGPHSSAQWRWDNAVAVGTPDNVKALLEAGGPYDVFMGTEAHGGSYTYGADPVGRASVVANTTQYSPPAQSGANVYALLWHNLAASASAQTYYLTFWRNDPPRIFGAAWRAAQEPEKVAWDSIFTYVNANKAVGTSNMLRVPLLDVFCAVYDGIQAGTVTGITMAELFSDDVHIDTPIGRWISLATQVAVLYRRHPNELPANAGTQANISPALAAQLRTIVWNTCLNDTRTGLTA